ncbi:MAG: hypothetical protein J2P54_08445 [Bradyrhizobiaceae bacterium]|nr:hypothetical protein [Bradyrhizobiaceae bacterium]
MRRVFEAMADGDSGGYVLQAICFGGKARSEIFADGVCLGVNEYFEESDDATFFEEGVRAAPAKLRRPSERESPVQYTEMPRKYR